jgi:hypothetical protein
LQKALLRAQRGHGGKPQDFGLGTARDEPIREIAARLRRRFVGGDHQIDLLVLQRAANIVGFGRPVGFKNQPALTGKCVDNQVSYDRLVFDNKNSWPAGSHEGRGGGE